MGPGESIVSNRRSQGTMIGTSYLSERFPSVAENRQPNPYLSLVESPLLGQRPCHYDAFVHVELGRDGSRMIL
jgi:hypothetical protein